MYAVELISMVTVATQDNLYVEGNLKLDGATLNDESPPLASAAHWQIKDDQLALSANFDAAQIQR